MLNIKLNSSKQKACIKNENQQKLSFGRALTTNETIKLKDAIKIGLPKIDKDFFSVIVPIAAVPSEEGKNTGIGTFLGLPKLMAKMSKLTGANSVQLLPTGEPPENCHYSPFSTPGFGLYHGYIDLFALTESTYGNLLNENEPAFKNCVVEDKDRNDYGNINRIEKALDKAFNAFDSKKDSTDSNIMNLNKEFNEFKARPEIKFWLDTYAEEKDSENPERYKFKQFIAEKQYQEMQDELKEQKIKLIVDCPIGFNESLDRKVAEKNNYGQNPFLADSSLACNDNGKTIEWGIPALNAAAKSAKSLIYHKALYSAKHGDGARIDASQYLLYPEVSHGGRPVYTPQEYSNNKGAIANPFLQGLKDGGAINYLCLAEAFTNNPEVDNYLKNNEILNDIPKFTCAQWGGTDTGSVDAFANHDIAHNHYYNSDNPKAIKSTNVWFMNRLARKVQMPFNDVVGDPRRINVGNSINENNWKVRLSESWESDYHEKLQNGLGYNAPEVIGDVLDQKGKNEPIKRILRKFAEILKETGAKTEEEANADKASGKLDEYLPCF